MTKPKLYCYVRASTQEQKETLETQRVRLEKEYEHRFKDDFEFGGMFTDAGVSGSTHLRSRPQGFKLDAALEKGDCVLITKLDRGFRNLRDFAELLEVWQERGIRLVLLDIQMDLGTPVGRMIAHILGAVAEFERERLRERIREGIARRRQEGRRVNQEAPYGFKWSSNAKKYRKLIPDPYTRKLGRQFVEWKKQGLGEERIWVQCQQQRIRLRNGQPIRSARTIDKYIRCELQLQATELRLQQQQASQQAPPQEPPTENDLGN